MVGSLEGLKTFVSPATPGQPPSSPAPPPRAALPCPRLGSPSPSPLAQMPLYNSPSRGGTFLPLSPPSQAQRGTKGFPVPIPVPSASSRPGAASEGSQQGGHSPPGCYWGWRRRWGLPPPGQPSPAGTPAACIPVPRGQARAAFEMRANTPERGTGQQAVPGRGSEPPPAPPLLPLPGPGSQDTPRPGGAPGVPRASGRPQERMIFSLALPTTVPDLCSKGRFGGSSSKGAARGSWCQHQHCHRHAVELLPLPELGWGGAGSLAPGPIRTHRTCTTLPDSSQTHTVTSTFFCVFLLPLSNSPCTSVR